MFLRRGDSRADVDFVTGEVVSQLASTDFASRENAADALIPLAIGSLDRVFCREDLFQRSDKLDGKHHVFV